MSCSGGHTNPFRALVRVIALLWLTTMLATLLVATPAWAQSGDQSFDFTVRAFGPFANLPDAWEFTITSDDPECLAAPLVETSATSVGINNPTFFSVVLPTVSASGADCSYTITPTTTSEWQTIVPPLDFDAETNPLSINFYDTTPYVSALLAKNAEGTAADWPRGWEFTISSDNSNCLRAPFTTILASETGDFNSDFVSFAQRVRAVSPAGDPCTYTVVETPVAGWVTQNPQTLTLPQSLDFPLVVFSNELATYAPAPEPVCFDETGQEVPCVAEEMMPTGLGSFTPGPVEPVTSASLPSSSAAVAMLVAAMTAGVVVLRKRTRA